MIAARKQQLKKASDHSDVHMFASALQFGTLVMSRHIYLHITLYNRLFKASQAARGKTVIVTRITTLISTIKQLFSMFLLEFDLDGLNKN